MVVRNYPTRSVRLIDPFRRGGGPDLIGRAVAQTLSVLWGQPVTVENHPGEGSTAGPALVAKSLADGYMLLVNTNAHAYSSAFKASFPYDPLKDFVPIAPITIVQRVQNRIIRGHPCARGAQYRIEQFGDHKHTDVIRSGL